ncbi:MAG: hypothetical protein ACXACY_29650, partial [Candidatus Hodarchaeales archaeon]
ITFSESIGRFRSGRWKHLWFWQTRLGIKPKLTLQQNDSHNLHNLTDVVVFCYDGFCLLKDIVGFYGTHYFYAFN